MGQPFEECAGHREVAVECSLPALVDVPMPVSTVANWRETVTEIVGIFELRRNYDRASIVRVPIQAIHFDSGKTLMECTCVVKSRRNSHCTCFVNEAPKVANPHGRKSLRKVTRIIEALAESVSRPVGEAELARRVPVACLSERVVRRLFLSAREDGIRESTSAFRIIRAWPFHNHTSHAVSEAGPIKELWPDGEFARLVDVTRTAP